MSAEGSQVQLGEQASTGDMAGVAARRLWSRRWDAAAIDERLRVPMIVAAVLVIPDLILEEQPLRASWHTVAVAGDWVIWLVFLGEFVAIMLLARDWRSWLRRYPLAVALLILTPPFAPASLQALRAFRLLRVLRVARGFQMLSKLLTLDGLKYIFALAIFLVLGGGIAFASVESHAGYPVSTWDGIWWAIGTVSTEGSNIAVKTDAGRAIAIVLMFSGIGVFSVLTAAVAQHFVASRAIPRATEISEGEKVIAARLDELNARLDELQASLVVTTRKRITDGAKASNE